jgi:hypothetical protein
LAEIRPKFGLTSRQGTFKILCKLILGVRRILENARRQIPSGIALRHGAPNGLGADSIQGKAVV